MVGILLYHGTTYEAGLSIKNDGILLSKSNKHLDFGAGFYTTPNKEFAIETGKRKFKAKFSEKPKGYAVVILELDEDAFLSLNQKCFFKPDDEWARFVIANRCRNDKVCVGHPHNRDSKYDVVIGHTADGKMGCLTLLANDVDTGKRSLKSISAEDVKISESENWGTQWSFHTPKFLACLTIKDVVYYEC